MASPAPHTHLYDILGVRPDASDAALRSAYHRLAKLHHPDRAHLNKQCPLKATAEFREIQHAYESLANPELRRAYDCAGEEGLRRASGEDPEAAGGCAAPCATFGPADIFAAAARSAGIRVDSARGAGRTPQPGRKKGQCVQHKMTFSLEDLYKGRTTQLAIERWVLKSGRNALCCTRCSGTGVFADDRLVGFGVHQSVRGPCAGCCGRGTTFLTERRREVLSVAIEPGMYAGDRVVLSGAADETDPDIEPGDIVVTIAEKPHPQFQRRGDDLLMDVRITLGEALCGFELPVCHLDGRRILISNTPGEIIRPGCVKAVENEGMPVRRRCSRGNLILKFDVVFPPDNYICEGVRTRLREALPGCPKLLSSRAQQCAVDEEYVERVKCRRVDCDEIGKACGKRVEACYESDDDNAEERCSKMMSSCAQQ